jgi:hypothetical protein
MQPDDEHKTFGCSHAPVNSALVTRDEDDLNPPVFRTPLRGVVLRDWTVFSVGSCR